MSVGSPPIAIEDLRPEHWPEVARIYAEGIATGEATFETEVPAWELWDASHLVAHRFVALRDRELAGWVAVSPVSDRRVYRGVVENSPRIRAASPITRTASCGKPSSAARSLASARTWA